MYENNVSYENKVRGRALPGDGAFLPGQNQLVFRLVRWFCLLLATSIRQLAGVCASGSCSGRDARARVLEPCGTNVADGRARPRALTPVERPPS